LFSLVPSLANCFDGTVDVVSRYRPLPGVVLGGGSGLPCFMVSPLMVCPALRPRPCPQSSLCGPRILPPLSQRRRPSGISLFRGSLTPSLRSSISEIQMSLKLETLDDNKRKVLRKGWSRDSARMGVCSSERRNESPGKEKELNMKTIVTLAVALLSGTVAWAEVSTKGGATQLMSPPPAGSSQSKAAMKCALCKSEFVRVNVPSFKGSPTSVLVERHGCKSCDSKMATTGHGKAKVSTTRHTCGNCQI